MPASAPGERGTHMCCMPRVRHGERHVGVRHDDRQFPDAHGRIERHDADPEHKARKYRKNSGRLSSARPPGDPARILRRETATPVPDTAASLVIAHGHRSGRSHGRPRGERARTRAAQMSRRFCRIWPIPNRWNWLSYGVPSYPCGLRRNARTCVAPSDPVVCSTLARHSDS